MGVFWAFLCILKILLFQKKYSFKKLKFYFLWIFWNKNLNQMFNENFEFCIIMKS